jgi:serine/threonine protein kinase
LTPKGEKSPFTDINWLPPEYSFGCELAADPSDDMYRLATTLSVLLFGQAGSDLQGIFENSKVGWFARMRKGQDKASAQKNAEMFFIDQIYPEIKPLVLEYSQLIIQCDISFKMDNFTRIANLQTQLEAFIKQHNKELYNQKGREIEKKMRQLMQPMTPKETCQYLFERFQTINNQMRTDTGQSYPEPVLMEFAEIMTDCLSEDPTQRPTAATVFRKVTHLAFSNWQCDATGKYKTENTYRIEGLPDW